jgi:hypothetical protein
MSGEEKRAIVSGNAVKSHTLFDLTIVLKTREAWTKKESK